MQLALHSWREDFPVVAVRGLAVMCALVVLSFVSSWIFQSPALKTVTHPEPRADWTEVERPFAAFALTIPEAGNEPASYAIRRHSLGGRKDIVTLGANEGPSPFLQIEVYRPGGEIASFGDIVTETAARIPGLSATAISAASDPLDTKFGALSLAYFVSGTAAPRACVAFANQYEDPRLQIFGAFCQPGEYVSRAMLSCAIDRFSLLAAASEPKVTALFAQAELHRTFCGQRSPLLAPTPQHRALWRAMAQNTR